MVKQTRAAEIYQWAAIVTGFSVLFAYSVYNLQYIPDWSDIVYFFFLAVLSEFLVIRMRYGNLSLSFAVTLSAYLVYGGLLALWAGVTGVLIGNGLLRRRPAGPTLFNTAQTAICIVTASLLAQAAGARPGINIFSSPAPAILLFPIAYVVVNHILVSTYFALRLGLKKYGPPQWGESFRWDGATYLITVPLGILMSQFILSTNLLFSFLVFAPLVTMAFIFRFYRELDIANHELSILYEVAAVLGQSLELEEILDLILRQVHKLIRSDICVIFFIDEGSNFLVPVRGIGLPERFYKDVRIPIGQGVCGYSAQTASPAIIDDTRETKKNLVLPGVPNPRSLISAPLLLNNKVIAVIALGSNLPAAFDDEDLRLLTILGSQAASAIENARLFKETHHKAISDPLTGLFNYRYFFSVLREEISRADSENYEVSVLMIDIDDFRLYNNKYGHLIGDAVLKAVAKILKDNTRQGDLVARYAGDEFVVILPRAGTDDAVKIAERIWKAVDGISVEAMGKLPREKITVSIGVATYPEHAENEIALLHQADRALISGGKRQGKNRVELAGMSTG